MNIIVVGGDGSVSLRPDTTLKWGVQDYWMPEPFSHVTACRCRFFPVLKMGKAVAPRFAGRYYDSWGPGVLIYGDGQNPYADDSTYLCRNLLQSAAALDEDARAAIDGAIVKITSTTLIRRGDVIVLEDGCCGSFKPGDTVNPYDDASLSFRIC